MTLRFCLVALLAGALAACAAPRGTREVYTPRDRPMTRPAEGGATSTPSPYTYREELGGYVRSPEEVSGPAVLALLSRARSDLAAGHADQAVASLETALTIEKRNPFIWQQLAAAHMQRNVPEDAEMVAQRSNSFAQGNPYIEIGNWRLIAAAREARGDTAGAQEARERVELLQERLDD
jgi:hypothetical protein